MVDQKKKDKTIINLANALSILRMIAGPLFIFAILNNYYKQAFVIIFIATITDFLDGQVARIWDMQTRFGRMLDPLADKIVIDCAVIAFLIKFKFPLWIGLLIIVRDLFILTVGIIYLSKNKKKVLKPNLLGKITTFFQMATIVIYALNIFELIKVILLIITAFLTLFSGLVYLKKGYRLFFEKKNKKARINLPNKITLARIAIIPIFIIFLLSSIPYKTIVAAAIFVILALSDALDGYLARKRMQVTSFGKLIDPLADKLLVSAALVFLIGKGIDPWIAYTIIAREFIITGLRMVAAAKNYVLPARTSGKIKTVAQVIGITAVLLELPYSYYLILAATIITIYSGIEYLWVSREFFKELS